MILHCLCTLLLKTMMRCSSEEMTVTINIPDRIPNVTIGFHGDDGQGSSSNREEESAAAEQTIFELFACI